MVALVFDARQVEPTTALDPVPAGWYPVMIVESEQKPTRDGQGAYLELQLKVMPGHQYQNRVFFDRLNLSNKNPTAVEIAYRTLSAICHAANVLQVQDSQQLHGIPIECRVSVRPADGQYDASNEVRGYRPLKGGGPSAMGPGGQFVPAQPGTAPAAPWMGGQPAPAPAANAPWTQPAQPTAPAQAAAPAPAPAPAAAPAQPGTAPWQTQPPTGHPAAPGNAPPGNAAPAAPPSPPTPAAPAGATPPWGRPPQ